MSEIENFRACSKREYFFLSFPNTPKAPSFYIDKKTIPTYAWQVGREIGKLWMEFEFSCLSLTSS